MICPECKREAGKVGKATYYCAECGIEIHARTNKYFNIDRNGNLRNGKEIPDNMRA